MLSITDVKEVKNDIDIFTYDQENLSEGVGCLKMKIQFVLGHLEHVYNHGCPIKMNGQKYLNVFKRCSFRDIT